MSLIKIENLQESETSRLASVTDLEFQTVMGGTGGSRRSNNPSGKTATGSVPTANLNSLNNYGTAVSYAFANSMYQQTPKGDMSLNVGGSFAGQYSVSGTQTPFVGGVYWSSTKTAPTVKK
jgi:hypothetical protein